MLTVLSANSLSVANPLGVHAPEAYTFVSQYGGAVGMMNDIHDELEEDTNYRDYCGYLVPGASERHLPQFTQPSKSALAQLRPAVSVPE